MRELTHDYASPGAYFVTVCSHQRHLLFEDAVVGEIITWAWNQIPLHFPNAALDAFVVMPNHLHGVIILHEKRRPLMVGAQHAGRLPSTTDHATLTTLSTVVRSFKAAVTRELRVRGLWDDQPFWQRNYYDRVVRNKAELNRIRDYIAHNPAAWLHDHENPDRRPDGEYNRRWAWLETDRA